MKRIAIHIMIFLAFAGSLEAQISIMYSDADSLVKKGADHIYNVKFDSAEIVFNKLMDKYPKHPSGYFLSAMVDWWKITLYRETDYYDQEFLAKIEKVIDVCDAILDTNEFSVTGLFFKGGALGYRGRYHSIRQEWLSAASDGKEAYDILKLCHELAPGNHDIMLGTGIYNYFAAALPEKYPIIKPLMMFLRKGDKRMGILQLRASAKWARYTSVEAKVVLLQVYYSFDDKPLKALEMARELFNMYPNNPYFHRYLGRSLVKTGNWREMEQVWREITKRCIKKQRGYDRKTAREALYYVGTALMGKVDYEMALRYLLKSTEGSEKIDKEDEESGFYINALIKIGKIYDRLGKRDKALSYYKQVLEFGDYRNSHNKVRRYIKTPY